MADANGSGWCRRLPWLICGAALAVFAMLIAFAARGPRGSDQYWYMADLVMMKSGRGMTSNFITPILWAADTGFSAERLPPPVHHVPVTYLAAGINAIVDNPYLAWVLCNAGLAIAAALLLYVLGRSIVRPVTAAVVSALFLLSPQTVWFTLNPLMEQSLVLAAVVLGLGAVLLFTRPVGGVLVMSTAVAFLAVSRASNLLLIPLGVALMCVLAWRGRSSWWLAAAFGAASTAFWLIAGALLPQYPIFSVKAMLALSTSASGDYGSGLMFYSQDVNVSAGEVVHKAGAGLLAAFIPGSAQEFLMESGAIVLLVIGIVWGANSPRGRVLAWWAVSLFAVYLGTCALMQAQSRYLAPVLPLALVLTGAAYERVAERFQLPLVVRRVGVVLLGGAVMAASAVGAAGYRTQAKQEPPLSATLRSALDDTGGGSLLVLDSLATSVPKGAGVNQIAAAYAIAPTVLVLAEGTQRATCVPFEQLARWDVTGVAAPAGWTDAQVNAAFCPAADGAGVSLEAAGDALAPLGQRLLLVRPRGG